MIEVIAGMIYKDNKFLSTKKFKQIIRWIVGISWRQDGEK